MGSIPNGWELVLIVIVIMVLFGAKRLPDASRSLGRSLRIFKAETKGLRSDDDSMATTQDVSSQAQVQAPTQTYAQTPVAPPAPITPPAPVAPPVTGQQPHTTP